MAGADIGSVSAVSANGSKLASVSAADMTGVVWSALLVAATCEVGSSTVGDADSLSYSE